MKLIRNTMIAVVFACAVMCFGVVAMASTDTYAVTGVVNYLALRTAKAYDAANEIGRIYEGQTVEVQSYDSGDYWYVYAPTLGKYGYVNNNYLRYAGYTTTVSSDVYTVKVDSGYLALRNAKAYDYANEIGAMYTGETVIVQSYESGDYWYVYSPSLNKYGYTNKNYLVAGGTVNGSSYTVKVASGYLALRTAKAYDYANEIGELYTGETVTVLDTSDSQYWYVYAPTLGKSGYVNKDYLVGASSVAGTAYTVSVSKGYLALRTAMAYDASNEIGALYSGDLVYLQEKTTNTYWYVYSPKYNKYGYVNKDYLYR